MFDRLTISAGFPWTIRAMGFIALFAALLSFPALLSGSSVLARPRKARKLFDNTALHDHLFLIFTCCTFFTFLGYIVPYFYIPTYAREVLGTSDSLALYMLVMSVAASFFGRLGSGVAAHYMGSIVTWMLCAFGSGILSLCWISIKTEGTFIAFSVLWGMSASSLLQVNTYVHANHTRRLPLRWPSDTSLGGLCIYLS
jgi:predicted MFS family arabinose efflux permease